MLKPFIREVLLGHDLKSAEMAKAIGLMMDGQTNQPQVAALLIALRAKGETSEEIAGAASAMRSRMHRIHVKRTPLVDTCGTGGSGTGSFNISTAVALVAASCGAVVAKHGNRAISSKSGSADVLTELGVNIDTPLEQVTKCIEEVGIGFLFAPNHHPALRHVATTRRELGIRTMFNALGPLCNPAGATRQVLGVYDRTLLKPLAEVLSNLGTEYAWIVYGEDGLDELTVCDTTHIAQWDGADVTMLEVAPEDIGLPRHPQGSLQGGTPQENAQVMKKLLAGQLPGAIQDAVILNTAALLYVSGLAADLQEGRNHAEENLATGKPFERLQQLKTLCI